MNTIPNINGMSQASYKKMIKLIESLHTAATPADSFVFFGGERDYVVNGFLQRSVSAKRFAVIPPQIITMLFTADGYFLGHFLNDSSKKSISQESYKLFYNKLRGEFAFEQYTNKITLSLEETDRILQSQHFENDPLSSKESLSILRILNVDVLLIPRIVIVAVGTDHADSLVYKGVQTDTNIHLTANSSDRSISVVLDLLTIDATRDASGPFTDHITWRSPTRWSIAYYFDQSSSPFPLKPAKIAKRERKISSSEYLSAIRSAAKQIMQRFPYGPFERERLKKEQR